MKANIVEFFVLTHFLIYGRKKPFAEFEENWVYKLRPVE